MVIKYTKILHSKDPPKFTQFGISGLKTNHLATPVQCQLLQEKVAKLASRRFRCNGFLQKLSDTFQGANAMNNSFGDSGNLWPNVHICDFLEDQCMNISVNRKIA
jgi:hypothetical protein